MPTGVEARPGTQSARAALSRRQRAYFVLKSIADVVLAWVGLVVLSPVFLGIVIAIKLEDGWRAPVLFRQKRVGMHGTHFQLYKFRSMCLDTPHDRPTHLLEDPERYITKVGRLLRKTSLDELPQLWNIACYPFAMAVIGPRPALWNQYDLVELRDRCGANGVKPGLTGLAQIRGRDELELEEKAAWDGEYVRKFGPLLDVRCFFGTIRAVVRHDGVVEGGTGPAAASGRKGEHR